MEKLVFALQITGIGFAVVFVVFIMLYGVMVIYKHLFTRSAPGAKPGRLLPESIALPSSVIAPPLVAAIAAAVSCYQRSEDHLLAENKVLSPPLLTGGSSGWADAGRKTLMEGKLRLENLRRS